MTEETSKVAETLAEFRGRYRYNLLDENVRRFNAEVPMLAQWDDHEVRNNWYPGPDARRRPVLGQERRPPRRAGRGGRSSSTCRSAPRRDDPERIYRSVRYGPSLEVFLLDQRSYRGPNSANRQAARTRPRPSSATSRPTGWSGR